MLILPVYCWISITSSITKIITNDVKLQLFVNAYTATSFQTLIRLSLKSWYTCLPFLIAIELMIDLNVGPYICQDFRSIYHVLAQQNFVLLWSYLTPPMHFLNCQSVFGVPTLEKTAHDDFRKLASAIYLQVSTISQALIFVTRSRNWSYIERPGLLLVAAFVIAQLVSKTLSTATILLGFSHLNIPRFSYLSKPGRHFDRGVCKLELCSNWRDWVGLGRGDLALQYHLLYPARYHQILDPLRYKRKGLGSCSWAKGINYITLQRYYFISLLTTSFVFLVDFLFSFLYCTDCFHEEEGFRKRATWAQMGTRAEDPPRPASTGHQIVQWNQQFLGAESVGRGSKEESWDC